MSKCIIVRLLPLSILCCAYASQTLAVQQSVWEAGLGIGGLSLPSYIGSDQRQNYVLPIPYFVYRGKRFRFERSGVYGDLFERERIKLNISLSAAVPVKSDSNGAREGMPDLDPSFELGPALNFTLSKDENSNWSVRLPLRAVIATDFSSSESLGWVASPQLFITNRIARSGGDWKTRFYLGPVYATEGFHDYYYQVDDEFATPTRPSYDARGGYGGMRMGASLRRRVGKVWLGMFLRYDNIDGAVFDDSPLIESKHALLLSAGIAWVFAKSGPLVQLEE